MPASSNPPNAMDHIGRISRLQASLQGEGIDALLVTHLPNIQYLAGFTGSSAVLFVSEEQCVLFTDGRYKAQAKDEVKGAKIVVAKKSPVVSAADWITKNRSLFSRKKFAIASLRTIGIESEVMSAASRDRLAASLKGNSRKDVPRVKATRALVERARMIKDTNEVLRIRRAVALGASLFPVALENMRPGVTEVGVAAAMEFAARRGGADGMSFSTILASGRRSAVVHGRASSARIPASGFVVCDFGVILAGYCSDRTRTVHVGKPSTEEKDFYFAVLEAQKAGIDAVRPNVTAAEVDGAARRVLRKHKLDRYFTHSTGHGLGLEIHESPRLAAGQEQKLKPGMVITVEPGAYVPGKWGVRIEDVVLVTSSGCEVLSPENKELIVI